MSSRGLIEKIEALPPDKRVEVETFVDSIASRAGGASAGKTFPDELLRSINEGREELRRTHGHFDTLPLIREFRETGGR